MVQCVVVDGDPGALLEDVRASPFDYGGDRIDASADAHGGECRQAP